MVTREQTEEVKRLQALDKQNYQKMLKQRQVLQNNIRQMSMKMQAERDRDKTNPSSILHMKQNQSINCKQHQDVTLFLVDEYMLPDLLDEGDKKKNMKKKKFSVPVLQEESQSDDNNY